MTTDLLGQLTRGEREVTARFELRYDTDSSDLWEAITVPERLARWFATVEGDLLLGGHYRVIFDETDPGQRAEGTILHCEPPRLLVVSWIFPGETDSEVSVELHPVGDRTLLVLEHRRIPASAATGYGAGWQSYLEQLSAALSGAEGRGPTWDQRWAELKPAYEAQLTSQGCIQHS